MFGRILHNNFASPLSEFGFGGFRWSNACNEATAQGTKQQSSWQEKQINYNQVDEDKHTGTSILPGLHFPNVSFQGRSSPYT